MIARVLPTLGYPSDLARGILASIQGDLLSSSFGPAGDSGDLQLYINNRPIRTLNSSEYGRVDFQIPFDAEAGQNPVRIDRDGIRGVSFAMSVATLNPRLLWAQTPDGKIVPAGSFSREVVGVGDTIELFGDGFGAPVIAVVSGDPAPEDAMFEEFPEITIYSSRQSTLYRPKPIRAGLAPATIRLSRITIVIPEGLRGAGQVLVQASGGYSSVYLNIQ